MLTNYYRVTCYFKYSPATAFIQRNSYLDKFTLRWGFKDIARVAFVRKGMDEIRIRIFLFKSFGGKKTNGLVVTGNKLTKFRGPAYKRSRAGCGPRAVSWTKIL
jgi:hypothetical protein